MVILLDLDGTLTDTAYSKYKELKDGKIETQTLKIPLIPGAIEFVNELKRLGHRPIIVSDSHPNYVRPIAKNLFGIEQINLTDKPNTTKTIDHLEANEELFTLFQNKDNFLMVGDSFLDIELGRRLNVRTVLTKFYSTDDVEERDGIGDDWKPLKMGPTYYAKTYADVLEIIREPLKNLLAVEAAFQGEKTGKAVRFKDFNGKDGIMAFRCLARQEGGEIDKYSKGDKYYQIENPLRGKDFLETLSLGVSNYLDEIDRYQKFKWDYFTYVSDKITTQPPNKMKEIFDLVESKHPKIKLFEWRPDVKGSLRNQPNYEERRKFIDFNLSLLDGIDYKGKNIIILDDQFTTSATAYSISTKLRAAGAKNILFIALFYLVSQVHSMDCPICKKPMAIKINRKDGNKFYSCTPPRYKGEGCGNIINIANG
ncbi:MAG: HAD family hydrolase [Algoriphagus sp.]|nr:HAD family hydrolase [Algoriphagus sp.]